MSDSSLCVDILRDVMSDEPMHEDIPVLQGSDAFVARMVLDQLNESPSRSGVAAVLEAADKVTAHVQAVAEVRELAESWRYNGEFGWGPWQSGEGPDPEGFYLDMAAGKIREVLDRLGV